MNRPYEEMTDEPDVAAALLARVVALEGVVREHQAALECRTNGDRRAYGEAVVEGRRLLDEMEEA